MTEACFNAGINNPCQNFTHVLLNAHISCDDNCVVIILDYQPRVINSNVDKIIVFRKNQSLHVSSINVQMMNVSFGSIQINSRGSSNMTFENLLLILGSVSFSSFKQVEFKNAAIKYSYYCNSEWVLNFLNVETVIIQHTNFQTSLSQGAESLVFAKNVNTAVLMNCSLVGNNCNFSSVVKICASKITIEQCTFKGYHIPFVLLGIGVCFEAQEINYSIAIYL